MSATALHRSAALLVVASLAAAVPCSAGFSGTDVFLPMAGRQAGAHPSNWYTTVWIHNPGAEAVTATVSFLNRGTANPSPPAVDVLVAPGATAMIENAVESLFHVQAFGALRVTSPTGKLVVTSRVYSKALGEGETDSVGQDFAGVPAAFAIGLAEKTQVLGVHQTIPTGDSDFRFNFGFVETTGHSATVRVRAIDDAGVEQGVKDFQVREFSQRQVAFKDHFPDLSSENMRLEMEVVSGSGRVIAYGSAIANGSQDPTTFEMAYNESLLGSGPVQHDDSLTGDGSSASPLGIADGGVTTAMLAAGAVGAAQLPPQVVTEEKLADASVSVHKLATVPPPAPAPAEVSVLMADPLEQFFKLGEDMFWAPAYTGDITAVNTPAASGLSGGATEGDATLAIADLGVTTPRLADRAVTAAKIDATPPSGDDPLKLEWSPTTGTMHWGPDHDSTCPLGIICGSNPEPVLRVTNTAVGGYAIHGEAIGTGVEGHSLGIGHGVAGVSESGNGIWGVSHGSGNGVAGQNLDGNGVHGTTRSGNGVHGQASETGYGVYGESMQGIGVYGVARGQISPALAIGVEGVSVAVPGIGVHGLSIQGTGVEGESSSGVGVHGQSGTDAGVEGTSAGATGVRGTSETGVAVQGLVTADGGVAGSFENSAGRNSNPVLMAVSRAVGVAVWGRRENGGREGYLGGGFGAYGKDNAGHSGYLGGAYGAEGESDTTQGYLGGDSYGAYGVRTSNGNFGYLGSGDYGALGRRGDDSAVGYLGGDHGVYGRCLVGGARYAGYFNGPVRATSLAGTGNRDVYANNTGDLIISTSDGRLKKDVLELAAQFDVLAALARLRGVTYAWDTAQERAANLGDQREIGMIAQEVEAVLPELVGEGADGYKSLDYAKLSAFLVEVTKAQQARIDTLEARLAALEAARP